jgi:hypothetical protein
VSRSTLRTFTDPFFNGEPHNDGLMPDHGDAVMDVPGPQDWDRIRLAYGLLSLLER